MALPPADELSRWTVAQVNAWLSENSLTAFRDAFLKDCIDGSKLMRMKPADIDQRYNAVPSKKRSVLKDIICKVESSPRPPPTWISPPQLPPRPKQPVPVPSPTESDDEEIGWSDSFDEDEDHGDYVEPTTQPSSGAGCGSVNQNTPCKSGGMEELEVYEQVEEDPGLHRKASLLGKLRTALDQRSAVRTQEKQDSDSDGESYLEPVSGPDPEEVPPPRPPRFDRQAPPANSDRQTPPAKSVQKGTSGLSHMPAPPPGVHRPPRPPPLKEPREPEDVYEVMEDAPDSVNGDEEYVEPDVPSPPGSVRGKVPPEPTQDKKSSRMDPPPMQQKKLSREEPAPLKSTVIVPPRPVPNKISNTTPPSVSSAQAIQASSKDDDLSSYSWFHGNIRREDADYIFKREHMEGMFLIRKSDRKPDQPYTLVLWHDGRMWNLPVRLREDKKYAAGSRKADESAFDSIVELVEHFKIRTLNLKSGGAGKETTVTLRQAAPKH